MQLILKTRSNIIVEDSATRDCLSDGLWDNMTDYAMCKEMCMEVDAMNNTVYSECNVDQDMELDISLHVYFVGNLYSFNIVCFWITIQVTQYPWLHC